MGLRINTNVLSLGAQRALEGTTHALGKSMEKMSSGSRINRAADDAAGLAISEKMGANIRSMRQGIRNANDGISMVQTAEGSMSEINNILVRFRELSIQAASDTVGDVERGFIDKEVQQLRSEVDRIAQNTEFNGRKLLVGESGQLDIQVGLNNTDNDRFTFSFEKTNSTADALGISDISTRSKEEAQQNLGKVDEAIKRISENRSEMGAFQNRLQSSVNNMTVYAENLSNARSRIRDTDVATESSELVRQNILSSMGTSVLSQANVVPQSALKLVG